MKLDAKFYGEIRKIKNDEIVSEDEYVVFLAKDNAFADILPEYLKRCEELKCDNEQIEAVKNMIVRLRNWRKANWNRLKNPDAKGEKMYENNDNSIA